MLSDLRHAVRQLLKYPSFTCIAVLSLMLGIGATTAIFSIMNGALLRPLPYRQPDQLAFVTLEKADGGTTNAIPNNGQYLEWANQARSFSSLAAYDWTFNFLILGDRNQSLEGMLCSSSLFETLGLKPQLGRTFLPGEHSFAEHPVVLIGHRLWQERFAGDPGIVGKTIQLSRMPLLTVIGVMPPGIRFLPSRDNAQEPNYNLHGEVDYWIPGAPDPTKSENGGWNVVARLKPGVSVQQARAEIAGLVGAQARKAPAYAGLTAAVTPIDQVLSGDIRRVVVPLFGAVCFVLLVAAANVAGLLLVRGLGRQRELAIRSALGAGWPRLVRLVLTESLLLSLAGGALGGLFAYSAVRLLLAAAPNAIPRLDQVSVDLRVLGFTTGISLLTGLATGLITAWQIRRPDVNEALKQGGRAGGNGPSRRRVLGLLVAGEISLTLVLLVGTGLMLRTVVGLARVAPGYATDRILTMVVTTLKPNAVAFHQEALDRVGALPGVKAAAFVWGLPLTGNNWMIDIGIEGRTASKQIKDLMTVPFRSVSPDYFPLMGIRLRDGRGFTSHDKPGSKPVVIVNEELARRYFPNENPIGKRLTLPFGPPQEIIGVVGDIRNGGLSAPPVPEVYLSFFQAGAFSKHLVIRAQSDPKALAKAVEGTLREIDPGVVVEEIKTMGEIRDESISAQLFAMTLLGGFSIAAVALSMVGIYGVMSYMVLQRSYEIGIRMAVGAQPGDVRRMVLRQGLVLALAGIAGGLLASVFLTGALKGLLYGVASTDPLTLAVIPIVLAAVVLLSCWFPARRATRIDPISALRSQ